MSKRKAMELFIVLRRIFHMERIWFTDTETGLVYEECSELKDGADYTISMDRNE